MCRTRSGSPYLARNGLWGSGTALKFSSVFLGWVRSKNLVRETYVGPYVHHPNVAREPIHHNNDYIENDNRQKRNIQQPTVRPPSTSARFQVHSLHSLTPTPPSELNVPLQGCTGPLRMHINSTNNNGYPKPTNNGPLASHQSVPDIPYRYYRQ